MKSPQASKMIGVILGALGLIFLIFPLVLDSYSHFLQDQAFRHSQDQTISCRAKLALNIVDHPGPTQYNGLKLEKLLDGSCGTLPKYDNYAYQSESQLLAFYNWVVQKITFIPL